MRLHRVLAALVCIFLVMSTACTRRAELHARMGDFSLLRKGPDLAKLYSTTQYYLAENLGLPAITDWVPGRLSPGFATRWEFDGATVLKLKLRDDLKWSDGTPVSNGEILAHFERLKKQPGYHTPSFPFLKTVRLDERTVTLVFERPVPHVLEELCRADAVLHSGDWHKTSGAYSIAESTAEKLVLARNKHLEPTLLQGVVPPERVVISQPPLLQVPDLFKRRTLDFSLTSGPAVFPPHETWAATGALPYWGALNMVHYVRFSPDIPLSHKKALAAALFSARGEVIDNPHFTPFDEMIPVGYPSYLAEGKATPDRFELTHAERSDCERPGAPSVPLKVWDVYNHVATKSGAGFIDVLRGALAHSPCRFEIQLLDRDQLGKALALDDRGARIDSFLGNARDPDGSWSFLSTSEPRVLHDANTRRLLDEARHATTAPTARAELFKKAHRRALESLDVIPLFISANAFFHDPKLDVSRINPLDLRVRFWMMQWTD